MAAGVGSNGRRGEWGVADRGGGGSNSRSSTWLLVCGIKGVAVAWMRRRGGRRVRDRMVRGWVIPSFGNISISSSHLDRQSMARGPMPMGRVGRKGAKRGVVEDMGGRIWRWIVKIRGCLGNWSSSRGGRGGLKGMRSSSSGSGDGRGRREGRWLIAQVEG
jgi:hypothetical protein